MGTACIKNYKYSFNSRKFQKIPNPDFEVSITIENQVYPVYVSKRPFVDKFIENMSQYFELVVFTASVPKYADPVLDFLDPKRLIKHRLYRNNCVLANQAFVKDLSKLGRVLNKTLIIDNSAFAFQFHPKHSILIESWFDNEKDEELDKLLPFLEELSRCDDVRPLLHQWKTGKYSRLSM